MSSWARGAVVAGGGAVPAVASLVLATHHPQESVARGSTALLALEACAGAILVAAGAVVWLARGGAGAGALLAAAGVAVDLRALPLPDAGGSVLFTAALVFAFAAPPLAAAALLLHVGASRVENALALAGVGASVAWAGLAPALLFDARATGCFDCPRNLVLVHGDESAHADALTSGLWASALLCVALAAVLAARAVRSLPYWPLVAGCTGGCVALSAWAVELLHRATTSASATDATSRGAWAVTCVALLIVAAAPVADVVRAWVESMRIVDSILAATPAPEQLRAALAASAGDPSLALVFPYEPGPSSESVTNVVRGGEIVAELRHGPLPAQAARRLAAAARAAGLALEHAAARARLRAQLRALTASRTRIVEVADAERRRLERDLHDGAQQRLIALSVALAGHGNGAAADARAEILAALEDLRALAHGIHPASLSDGGIVSSVRELADGSRVPLRLDLRPVERLPAPLETAAYRVVADCVRAAERSGGRAVALELSMTDRSLNAELHLVGVPAGAARRALTHAIDRVTAVGGELAIDERAGETVVGLKL
jgi:signal transduction histidine kinase